MSAERSLLYLGGIDLPMPQARAVQTLHTAHALASQGCRVRLAVGRAPRAGLASVLGDYGLRPLPNLGLLALPALRLPHLPPQRYTSHPRLAAWNWSYGLAAILATRLLPAGRRPRLIFARDPRLAALFIAARRFSGAEVVYEVHELFSTRARTLAPEATQRPPNRIPRMRRLEEQVFRGASRLITLTEACRRILVDDFGVAAERVLVAPDAVASVPTGLPPRDPDSRRIVYAGQLYPWKGVGTLVRALTALPQARLEVVGGLAPGDRHAAELRKLAIERDVFDRIDFTGFLPHARVGETIAGAAAAVVPLPDNPMARYFTSPLKLFEYMAAGLPIVASDLPAIREVLQNGHNALLVPPDDPLALAAALHRLLGDPALADRLRAQAHADVRGRTWAARAGRILEFLDQAACPMRWSNPRRAGSG